ncbi:hypothetical protein D3C72_721590 [compost metagenome]
MPTGIENARKALGAVGAKLLKLGLRRDYRLELRRYVEDPQGDPLSMDPTETGRGEPVRLVVEAPDVKPVNLSLIESAGGLVKSGDLSVKLPRTAELEAFLAARLDEPDATAGGPYPELERVEFWLNGEPYQAVFTRLAAVTVTFTVRKRPGG